MDIYEKSELEMLEKKTTLTPGERARKEVLMVKQRESEALAGIRKAQGEPQDDRG